MNLLGAGAAAEGDYMEGPQPSCHPGSLRKEQSHPQNLIMGAMGPWDWRIPYQLPQGKSSPSSVQHLGSYALSGRSPGPLG